MDTDEYDSQKRRLAVEYRKATYRLNREFALANNPHEVGDIITDHISGLKIAKISVGLTLAGYSECIYSGTELTKSLTPRKRQSGRGISQHNIVGNPPCMLYTPTND